MPTLTESIDALIAGDAAGRHVSEHGKAVLASAMRDRVQMLSAVAKSTGHQDSADAALKTAQAMVKLGRPDDRATLSGAGGRTFSAHAAQIDPERAAGAAMTASDVAEAVAATVRNVRSGGGKQTVSRFRTSADLTTGMSPSQVDAVLRRKSEEHVDSRTAHLAARRAGKEELAGTWCSPSMIDYSNPCPNLYSRWGNVNLPMNTVERGGIRYRRPRSFAEYMDCIVCYTEEEEAARTEPKPHCELECDEFEEIRLNLCAARLTVSSLQDFAFPETTQEAIDALRQAFEFSLSIKLINAMREAATPDPITATLPNGRGLIGNSLNIIASRIEWLRTRHHMASGARVVVYLPTWFRAMMQADATLRGGVDLIGTTHQRIDEWFDRRGADVEYVYGLQDKWSGDEEDTWGDDTLPASWPQTIKAIIAIPGAFQAAVLPMYNLSAGSILQSGADLADNSRTVLFLESAWALIDRCPEALYVTAPICVTGAATLNTTSIELSCDDF